MEAIDFKTITELKLEVARLDAKWRDYENNFILPVFKWADEIGYDLRKAVYENPGTNCVELFFRHLLDTITEYKAMKFAYEATPKQWSSARAPTLEAVAQTASYLALEKEVKELRIALRKEQLSRHE